MKYGDLPYGVIGALVQFYNRQDARTLDAKEQARARALLATRDLDPEWGDWSVMRPVQEVCHEVFATRDRPGVPRDFPVTPITTWHQRINAGDLVTCGTCGRAWDNGVCTDLTPVPAGRCPFEMYH